MPRVRRFPCDRAHNGSVIINQVHDVDLKLLRVFEAVVRCGGFSAAQAELNVGQSTISAQIGQLEVRLGARLCERGRGGFRLTEQGAAAHAAAQRLLSAIDHFRIEADQLKRTIAGTLNLGVIDNTVNDELSPLRDAIQLFSTRGRDVEINIYVGMPSELEQRVLDGRLHIAVGHFPFRVPGLASTALYQEEHGLFCNSQHPLAKPDLPAHAMNEGLRSAHIVARSYLRRRDLNLLRVDAAASTADSVEAQAILILSTDCVGFMPLHYGAPWVTAGKMKQLIPDRMILQSEFCAITRRVSLPMLVRSFLSHLEEARDQRTADVRR